MDISIAVSKKVNPSSLKEIGFSGADFSLCQWEWFDRLYEDEYEELILKEAERIKNGGLKISQTHLPYYPGHLPRVGDGSYEAFEEYMLPKFIRGIELTHKIGGKITVIHSFEEADRSISRKGNITLYNKLLPYLEKYDITLCIENLFGANYSDSGLSTADDILYYTDTMNNPHIAACLDTGHSFIRGQKIEEMLKKELPALKALHINTNDSKHDLHLLPFFGSYMDDTDWKNVGKLLKDGGYTGNFNMELQIPGELSEAGMMGFYKLAYEVAKEVLGEN